MSSAAGAPPSRTTFVVERLRAAITSGELGAETQLRANELAERWSVSPTPVREAFQRLAADGFLVHTAHRGVRVASISADELGELYGMRVVVEPAALSEAVRSGGEQWTAGVSRTWDALCAARDAQPFDRSAYEAAHRAWHNGLVSAAGSSWWPRLVHLLRDQCQRYWVLGLTPRPLDEVMREHAGIQAAALAGEADRAATLLREHIVRGQSTVSAQLSAQEAQRTGP